MVNFDAFSALLKQCSVDPPTKNKITKQKRNNNKIRAQLFEINDVVS